MDSANKTFFLMVVLTMVCFGITLYQFFNPVKDNVVQNQENLNKNNEINISDKKTDFLLKNEVSVLNEKITYESDKLKVVFNANSGDISNVFIKTSDDKSFDIVKGNALNNALKLKLGSWKDGVDLNTLFDKDSIYTFSKENNKFKFACEFSSGIDEEEIVYTLEKIYTFYEGENLFHVDLKLSNNKNKSMRFDSSSNVFSLGWGPSLGVSSNKNGKKDERYEQFRYMSKDKIINLNPKHKIFRGTNGLVSFRKSLKDSWLVSDSHYFTSVIIPDGNEYDYFFDYSKSSDNLYYCGFSLVSDTVAKDASKGKRLLGYLNPDGGISALSSAEIATRYSNIKTQDQLVNMMTVVDKEGGSVAKMFDVEHQEGFLSKITKKIPFLSGKKEKETPLFDAAKKMFGEDFGTKSNQELIEAVRNITPDNAKALEGLEDVVGSTALCKTADEIEATAKTAAKKGVLNDKNNPLTYYARNIAANFETLSLALTAGFLGFGLPRLNEVMTMKKHLDKPTTNPERVSNPVGGCSNGQIFSTIKSKDVKTFQSFV